MFFCFQPIVCYVVYNKIKVVVEFLLVHPAGKMRLVLSLSLSPATPLKDVE